MKTLNEIFEENKIHNNEFFIDEVKFEFIFDLDDEGSFKK